jgi:hypothetical protein
MGICGFNRITGDRPSIVRARLLMADPFVTKALWGVRDSFERIAYFSFIIQCCSFDIRFRPGRHRMKDGLFLHGRHFPFISVVSTSHPFGSIVEIDAHI